MDIAALDGDIAAIRRRRSPRLNANGFRIGRAAAGIDIAEFKIVDDHVVAVDQPHRFRNPAFDPSMIGRPLTPTMVTFGAVSRQSDVS